MNRNQRKSQILQMTRRYPFSASTAQTIVKYTRKFKQSEYSELRPRIERHSKLKQDSVIKLLKAYESKKNHYFDIFFQRVHYSLRQFAHNLNSLELATMKEHLIRLCSSLMINGINPIVGEQLLGVSKQRRIKLFLDIDYVGMVGNIDQLVQAKNIEISNLFKTYQHIAYNTLGRQLTFSQYNLPIYKKQQPRAILNGQYNVHHNVSPSHFVQKSSTIQAPFYKQHEIKKDKTPNGMSYLIKRNSLSKESQMNLFTQQNSKVSELQASKKRLNQNNDNIPRQNRFERQLSQPHIDKLILAPTRLKSDFLKQTTKDVNKNLISSKSKQYLRMSFDKLNSKLTRLSLALNQQKNNLKNQQPITQTKINLLQTLPNIAVSEVDQEETHIDFNNVFPEDQVKEKEVIIQNPSIENSKKLCYLNQIHQKVKNAFARTQLTFKRFNESKGK